MRRPPPGTKTRRKTNFTTETQRTRITISATAGTESQREGGSSRVGSAHHLLRTHPRSHTPTLPRGVPPHRATKSQPRNTRKEYSHAEMRRRRGWILVRSDAVRRYLCGPRVTASSNRRGTPMGRRQAGGDSQRTTGHEPLVTTSDGRGKRSVAKGLPIRPSGPKA
jgi:hypothetical protein